MKGMVILVYVCTRVPNIWRATVATKKTKWKKNYNLTHTKKTYYFLFACSFFPFFLLLVTLTPYSLFLFSFSLSTPTN